jgi:hypothetical protein
MTHPTLKDTLELVKQYHIKLDKTGDIPYFWHLLRVMLRINTENEDVLHIALLHDIVEDTSITLNDLKNLGYNDKVIEGVRWCSKNEFPNSSFIEWMTEFGEKAPLEAVLVKISDISDNLGFERMRGLMTPVSQENNSKKIKKHQYPIQARIEKKVKKQMRLHGEMGVFDRYYKGWNAIFQNEKLLPLIEQVKINDFCNINDLLKLKNWLSTEDFTRYFSANKLTCWQITGEVKVIQDRKGQDYLALNIDDSIGYLFQNILTQQKELPEEFICNQQNRDHQTFHITLVNVIQYQKLIKEGKQEELLSIINQKFDLFNYGIGTSIDNKKDAQAWFAVLENAYLDSFRNKLGLDKQHYHITLAFKNSDVFIHSKNRNSIIFNNQELWSSLSVNKPKNKLKF